MVRKNKGFDVKQSWVRIPPLLFNFWNLTTNHSEPQFPSLEWANDTRLLRVVGAIQ